MLEEADDDVPVAVASAALDEVAFVVVIVVVARNQQGMPVSVVSSIDQLELHAYWRHPAPKMDLHCDRCYYSSYPNNQR